MGDSLVLFRISDIDVRVHWSFVLILAYGAFVFGAGSGNPIVGALYGILIILLLFVCVTLHEFGHALVAQYFKVSVTSITLLPIGGVADLERMPDRPMQEFLIAIAGPLVNFALALVLLPFTLLTMGMEMHAGSMPSGFMEIWSNFQTPGVGNLLLYLVVTNIILGVFNLLPAFPMDGGRILRSLLAMAMSYIKATRIAVFVGRVMAVLFAIWGIFGGGIFLLLIAFFVYVGGGAEREAVESRTVLRTLFAHQALSPGAVNLYSSERINRAMDLTMTSYQTDYPVLDLSGNFIGVLTRSRLIQALKEYGADGRIVDVMLPAAKVPDCAPDSNLVDVWEKMVENGIRVVAIKEQGEFRGLITIDDITELVAVVGAAMENVGDSDTSNPKGEVAGQPADV